MSKKKNRANCGKLNAMFKPELHIEIPPSLEKEVKGVTFYLEDFLKDEAGHEREKRLHQYLSLVKEAFDDQGNYIDHGGTAKVYSFGERAVCIKIMKDRHLSANKEMYDLGNRPIVEFALMEHLHDFKKGGVRSPVAEACIESGESSMIIMEKLDAVNVQHVLNGSEGMPESFNFEKFCGSLEEYIDGLHQEKGIAHLDLFPRNVMIDRKTGAPYVIDFGRSELLNNLSDEEKQKSMDDDWNKYDELYLSLESFLENEMVKKEIIPAAHEAHTFEADAKINYSEALKISARHVAEELLGSGEEIANLPLGENRKDVFVSRSKELVTGIHQFELEGVEFWVGVRK